MAIEIFNGAPITENGWIIIPHLDKSTGKQVGQMATKSLNSDIQAKVDAICAKARKRKDQEALNRLKQAILHH